MNSKKEVFLIGRQKSEALSVFVFKQVSFMLPVFFLLNDEPVAKELHQRIATKCRVQLLRSKNSLFFWSPSAPYPNDRYGSFLPVANVANRDISNSCSRGDSYDNALAESINGL
jgi:hypothetical protein